MKNFWLLILFLTLTTQASAQMEYSVNTGVGLGIRVGVGALFEVSLEGSYPLKEKIAFNNSIQFNYSAFRTNYFWNPNGLPSSSSFDLTQFSYTRMNLISELDYKVLSFIRIGVGLRTGIRLHQNGQSFTQLDQMPNIPEQSNISLFAIGVTSKLRFDLKRIYIQLRYVHNLNNIWTYDAFNRNGDRIQGAVKSRPLFMLIGFKF